MKKTTSKYFFLLSHYLIYLLSLIMSLTHSQLKSLCQQYGLVPSKQYGQNYLINHGIVEKIVKAADLQPTDAIIEIGPGFGVLTLALARKVKKIVALEIEKKLIPYWENVEMRDKEIRDKVDLRWGNAIKLLSPISYLLSHLSHYKIVANLPYQITSQALRTILELPNKPSLIVVMVQKEVAQRICAHPPDMSLLALSVQYYGKPEIVDVVTKGNFWPMPKVDSAILRIKVVERGMGKEERRVSDIFFKFARAGFAQKRKQLWKNLAEGLKLDREKVKVVLREVMGDEKVRAEELEVEEWRRVIPSLS